MSNNVDLDETAHYGPVSSGSMLFAKAYFCIKSYEHSCLKLFLNIPEAVFKQQNPCSNHENHMLFEHGFWTFDVTRWALLCLRYVERRNVITLNVPF